MFCNRWPPAQGLTIARKKDGRFALQIAFFFRKDKLRQRFLE